MDVLDVLDISISSLQEAYDHSERFLRSANNLLNKDSKEIYQSFLSVIDRKIRETDIIWSLNNQLEESITCSALILLKNFKEYEELGVIFSKYIEKGRPVLKAEFRGKEYGCGDDFENGILKELSNDISSMAKKKYFADWIEEDITHSGKYTLRDITESLKNNTLNEKIKTAVSQRCKKKENYEYL